MSAAWQAARARALGGGQAHAGSTRWWALGRGPTAALLASLLFLLLIAPLVHRDLGRLTSVIDERRQTFELLLLVKSSLSDLDEAEAAQAEFLRTHARPALQRYRLASARVEADIARLAAAEGSGLPLGRAIEIRRLVQASLAALERQGTPGRVSPSGQAASGPAAGKGFAAQLRALGADVEAESWKRIDELTERAHVAHYRLNRVLYVTCLLGLGFVALTGLSFNAAYAARRQAEQRQALLLRELNHRVKNIFAMVQSMAFLAGREADSFESFRDGFHRRLQALASANELLTGPGWQAASLEELVRRALRPHGLGSGQRFELRLAPGVEVTAGLAQDLALALHELATNAVKHGAFAHGQGRVVIEAEAVGPDRASLCLVWREEGGPPTEAPSRQGFGTRLLATLFGRHPGGRIRMEWRPEGLVCRIEAPLEVA